VTRAVVWAPSRRQQASETLARVLLIGRGEDESPDQGGRTSSSLVSPRARRWSSCTAVRSSETRPKESGTDMTPKSLTHRALIATLAIAPMLACGMDSQDPELLAALEQDQELTVDELLADAEYMREVFEENDVERKAIALDLGDDRQYRFLVNRLRSAGMTPLSSPELFDRVENARFRAMNDLVPRSTERCDMFITTDQ